MPQRRPSEIKRAQGMPDAGRTHGPPATKSRRQSPQVRRNALRDAADVFECSDEKLRKLCELTAGTKRPLGIKIAGRWLASVPKLLDDLEQGILDRDRRGPDERRRAEERAKKYEGGRARKRH